MAIGEPQGYVKSFPENLHACFEVSLLNSTLNNNPGVRVRRLARARAVRDNGRALHGDGQLHDLPRQARPRRCKQQMQLRRGDQANVHSPRNQIQ